MAPKRLGFAASKDSTRAAKLALILAVLTFSFLWEGCSAVQNASSTSSTQSQATRTIDLPAATVGESYQQILTASTSSQNFQLLGIIGQLPPGLSLNPQTAMVAGVPTKAGTFTFTVKNLGNIGLTNNSAQDPPESTYAIAVGSQTEAVSLQVSASELSVAPGGKLQLIATVKNTSNTAVTWSTSAGTISASGLLTAPSGTSLKSITVTATSTADPSVHSSATVEITSQTFSIATTSLPAGVQSTPYSESLVGSGGQPPYEWSIISGSLPSGLQLNTSTGTLAGTTSVAGTFTISIQGKDSDAEVAQKTFSLVIDSSQTTPNCGPPSYCSRTDYKIVQVPVTLPNVGNLTGANTLITDPDFNNRIVRITDGNTDPHPPYQNRSFMTVTSGSADENIWNLDSTLLVVQDTGARGYPFSFDPTTMQASRMYVSQVPETNGLTLPDSGAWSHLNANLIYVIKGTAVTTYDFTDRTTPPTPQPYYNFASSAQCLGAGFNATWQTRGGLSADDTILGMGYSNSGDQGTGVYAVAYKAGSGCTVLNTQTGKVTGDWGATGTINIPDRWLVHNVKISKDGNWLVIATAGCLTASCSHGPYFWQIGTTNVSSCGAGGYCGGHWTEGYTHWVNNNDTPIFNQVIRTISVPDSVLAITHSLPVGLTGNLDQHQSWNNVDPNDSLPLLSTTRSPTFPFPAPWYNEIIGLAPGGSGTIWRFAHNFISTNSQWFSIEEGIGSVSQDGRFFAFSSDWMGHLGSEAGTSNCKLGTNCRGDVFVVELK
jgi:hypothetical protein